MAKKAAYVLIFLLIALTIGGIAIGIVVLNDQDDFGKEIELMQDGVTKENFDIGIEGLYPTKSVEYTIKFGSKTAKSYDVVLCFVSDGQTELARFLNVDIMLNGETVETGILQEYIDQKEVLLDLSVWNDRPAEVILRYTMAAEVGNEAQNLVADFKVVIEATAEK